MKTWRSTFLGLLLALTLSAGVFVATPVFAQAVDFAAFGEAAGFNTDATITVIIALLIRTAISFVGVVAVAFMVYGGFVWMTSGGDASRIKKAKGIIKNAVIGLLLVFASFAIVSFVLDALVKATGGDITGSGGDGGDYTDGGGGSVFYLNSVNTQCAESLQNLQLQFVFSKTVNSDTVAEGIAILDSTDTQVSGTFSTSGRTVTFTPSTACDSPYETEYCFEANSSYSIEVDSTIVESRSGSSLTCTSTYPCSFTFTTGTEVDVGDPTVEMDVPEDGESLYAGSIELLQALTTDDSGVSMVDFYVIDDDEAIYSSGVDYSSAGAVTGSNVENAFFTDTAEEWYTQGYTTNEEYDIWATGYDCAGNTDTASRVTIVLRAANCNNGVLDDGLGEEEVDCGGDSSSAYYCGACDGDQCTENSECASGQCVDGTCVTIPKIEGVSPGDGAPGNLITISGEGFGDDEGTITFLGTESGDEVQVSAYACNSAVQWSDSEVIVQVPGAAIDGPISITTSSAETERTDDDYGPSIVDFDVNAIERPGICDLDPDEDDYGSSVDVYGNSFGDNQGSSTFYFTNYEASSYVSWSDAQLEVVVPNVNSGNYRAQVFTGDYLCVTPDGEATATTCSDDDDCDTDSGESCATAWCSETLEYCDDDDDCGDDGGSCESIRVGSNQVAFTVEDVSSSSSPIISYVDSGWKACSDDQVHCGDDDDCGGGATCVDASNWGPPGQYVTVYGTGFGTSTGSINFENESLGYVALGDTDFPDACGDDFWHDTYVTVKVPDTYLTENEDAIETDVTHALTVERADGQESDATDFVVLDDTPGPAICDIDPSSAPAGEEVTVYGENFGTGDGTVTFYSLQEADFSRWENDEISSVVVPDEAATGPVYVQEAVNGYTSNSITFTVGDCREDADLCDTTEGESCCANGSCSTDCEVTVEVKAHYAFKITTGITPNTPRVLVECSEDRASPTPWEGWSDSEDICVTVSVQAEFNMEMAQSTLNTSTVIVEECTELSDGECVTWTAVSASLFDTDETGFSWDPPSGGFNTSTLHRVTLLGGENIASADGGYLEEDYQWEFTTSSSGDPCEVGEVNVRPSEYTQTEQTDVDYSAQLIAANDICVAVSCSGYSLSWDSDFDGATFPEGAEPGVGVCTNVVAAEAETPADDPAVITATVTNAENNPFDDGELTINFLDPEIVDYFPQCSTACVNALPWAEFNTRMEGGTIGERSVTLYECLNSLCETSDLSELVYVDSVSFSGAACTVEDESSQIFYINFEEGKTLEPNTWYRVVVDGDAVMSCTGIALSESGSNYGTDENRYFEDDFSWVFKTKDEAVSCSVDSVTLDPELASMTYVGERAEFDATGKGAPDDCSVDGQTLQSGSFTWDPWTAADSPNNVGASSGRDSSQDEIVAYMIKDGAIQLTTSIPDYCTAACLNAGAPVTMAEGVCGNNRVEDSEECDDGGVEDGDGCSSICLNEGSSTTCGDGGIDDVEDCDDGNSTEGDGCSSICLNEGSRSVDATCGDGVQDWAANTGGEDCDDGNSADDDGCSRNCLLEGSASEEDVYAICGDGAVDVGEDCDPGDYDAEGDGCSSNCLYEGSPTCPSSDSPHCCGNGDIEPDAGEECDGEEGCSSSCLWAGSSYSYSTPSFCGDGPDLGIGEECDADSSASFSVGDYGVSQIAEGAPVEVDEDTGYAISTVSVTVDGGAQGFATAQLQCSCTTDASCDETGVGCGVSNCCFVRPRIVDGQVYPASNSGDLEAGGDGYCRNTAVWLEFSAFMDEDTFDETLDDDGDGVIDQDEFAANLYLDLVSVDSDGDGVPDDEVEESADCPTGYDGATTSSSTSAAKRFWNWMKSLVLGIFGRDVSASEAFACHVPVTYELVGNDDGTMRVYLRLSQLLEENAVYRLVVVGDDDGSDTTKDGVLSQYDVTLCLGDTCEEDVFVQEFEIGEDICDLDQVVVEDLGDVDAAEYEDPSIAYFSSTGEEHAFTATPQTYRTGYGYEEISPLTGLYEWSWAWRSSETDGEEGDVVASVAEISGDEDTTRNYTASGYSGREHVLSTATITVDELFESSTVDRTVTGTLEVLAVVCENPWPELDSDLGFPYLEDDLPSNFSFYYCRDAGEEGTEDDLPALEDPIDVEDRDIVTSPADIIQELIFKVVGSSDAIGVRVLSNSGYLTPRAWVEAQEFTGSFTETELDGYPAVSAGNTYYAVAANVSGSTIYPNMYIVSYNEDASDEAEEIFSQILSNWRFNGNTDEVTDINLCQDETTLSYALYYESEDDTSGEYVTCEWDGDCYEAFEDTSIVCDAQKGKLTRDMTRLLDVVDMATTIDAYGEANGHCSVTKGQSCEEDDECPGTEECLAGFPEVQSGTFVPALSNSIWSSWSAALGNELGTALPTDPVNEFYDCSDEGYDPASCWNGEEGTFICPENSHLYGYQSVGGEAYKLYAVLESDGEDATWAYDLDTELSDEVTVYAEYPTDDAPREAPSGFSITPVFCDGSLWGDSSLCGDGTQGSGETCELGDTTTGVSCTVCVNPDEDAYDGVECDNDSECGTGGTCANGTSSYACAINASNECYWDTSTTSDCVAYECGNGVVETGEICDDGSLNGTYGHCDDQCGAGEAFYCGDGYLAASEECDCGTTSTYATVIADASSWAVLGPDQSGTMTLPWCDVPNGQYSNDIDASCSYNCTQPGLACGDGRTNGSEECDGDYEEWDGALCSDGTVCTTDADCDSGACGDGGAACGVGDICTDYDDAGDSCTVNSQCDSGTCSSGICTSAPNAGDVCTSSTFCDSGLCGDFNYDLFRYRTCDSSCSWGSGGGWSSSCVGGTQICGNGTVEGNEVCDDGNSTNNDSCLNTCVENVCGDDYVEVGVESCDDGDSNGTICEAGYEDTCNYCSVSCQYKTASGGYCGDGIVDTGEVCDGAYSTQLYWFDGDTQTKSGTCDDYEDDYTDDQDNSDTSDDVTYTCRWLGVCNGGSENGSLCSLDYAEYTNSGAVVELDGGDDYNTCVGDTSDETDDGECIAPVCAADCGSSCPTNYETTGLLVQSEAAGATPTDSISLYSYLNAEGDSPDNGVVFIPSCNVATSITADVNDTNVVLPDVDIVFVTDLSLSMTWSPDCASNCSEVSEPDRRIDVVVDATLEAIEELFDAYSGGDGNLKIGLVGFAGTDIDLTADRLSVADGTRVTTLADSGSEQGLLSIVEDYTNYLAYGTPTAYGISRGIDVLNGGSGDVKIMVLLSDGEPYENLDSSGKCASSSTTYLYLSESGTTQTASSYSACTAEIRYDTALLAGNSNIIYYSAAIASNSDLQGYMAHMSSETCNGSDMSDTGDCGSNTYAFIATDSDGVQEMYEAIVDSILGTNVTFTTTDANGDTVTTTGEIQAGEDVELPFPEGFVCESTEQDIPIRNTFYGSGSVLFSDFNLTYCPYE